MRQVVDGWSSEWCNTRQHAATRCNTRQHTAPHCNNRNTAEYTATHTATHVRVCWAHVCSSVHVCCSVLQCGSVCCSVLQCGLKCVAGCCRVQIYCSVLLSPRLLECTRVLQCVAVCLNAMQCVAACCGVLQCAAVCCSALLSLFAYLLIIYSTYSTDQPVTQICESLLDSRVNETYDTYATERYFK